MQLTCLAGMAGAPVVSIPAARVDGLPVNVAAMAAPGRDRALLAWAAAALA
jgi:amidase